MNDTIYHVGMTATPIEGPSKVRLDGDALTWTLPRWGATNTGAIQDHPHEGCLKDFLQLAAVPEMERNTRVRKFAKAWGVLALDPTVRMEGDGDDTQIHYSEPVSVYLNLAAIVRSLLKVKKKLRADSQFIKGDFYRPDPRFQDHMAQGFQELDRLRVAGECGKIYDQLTLLTSYLEAPPPTLLLYGEGAERTGCFGICFSTWEEGYSWDRRKAEDCRLLPEGIKSVPSLWPWAPGTAMRGARPSALFQALVFHLQREMMPRPGWYICCQCRKEFQSNRKPRNGVALCDHVACRAAQDAENYQIRKNRLQAG